MGVSRDNMDFIDNQFKDIDWQFVEDEVIERMCTSSKNTILELTQMSEVINGPQILEDVNEQDKTELLKK